MKSHSFPWVREEYERDPHRELWSTLCSRLKIVDVTDLNSDVSFGYELKRSDGDSVWTLRLSMVGPYATVIRHDPPPSEAIVDGARDASSPTEAFIVESCAAAGYERLSRDLLNVPVELRLFDTAPDRVRMYQALFSDVDFLPGEFDSLGLES